MKMFLLILVLYLFGCSTEKAVQVQMVTAECRKTSPILANGEIIGCKVEWWDDYNAVPYTSYSYQLKYCDVYIVGVKYTVLVRR